MEKEDFLKKYKKEIFKKNNINELKNSFYLLAKNLEDWKRNVIIENNFLKKEEKEEIKEEIENMILGGEYNYLFFEVKNIKEKVKKEIKEEFENVFTQDLNFFLLKKLEKKLNFIDIEILDDVLINFINYNELVFIVYLFKFYPQEIKINKKIIEIFEKIINSGNVYFIITASKIYVIPFSFF